MAVARAVFSGLALSSAALAGSSVYNSPSNGFTTSVVYSTQDYTVTSCGPEVSNCPARATPTTFSVFPVPSTCAVTTTVTTTVTYTPTNPAEVKPTGTMGGPAAGQYQAPAWLPNGCNNTTPALSQNQTNGECPLGTKGAPTYNQSLPWGGQGGTPWGNNCTATNCNPYTSVPNTGVTRKYQFTISYMDIAPDGVQKKGIVVNNQFPGPTIEANWGDMIEVEVTNLLENEGTSIHWHGILQQGTPWMDGVPSVQQCPIAPGKTFTYSFQADLYGSTWYHSHYSAQYSGGAFGAIIIHGPQHADYDVDIGPVILSDWYHDDYYTLVEGTMDSTTGLPLPSNNNLINGKMNYPCANTTAPCTPNAGLSKFWFEKGKKYLLRLINTSADGMQKFSIDNHTITVVSQDFVPVNPYTTNVVTLGVAQRAEVIVEANGDANGAYWMRSQLGPAGPACCSLPDGISPNALAVVYYQDNDDTSVPQTTSDVTLDQLQTCANDPLNTTTPLFPISSDTEGTVATQELHIEIINNGTNFVWTVNNSTFRADYNNALLLNANQGQLNPEPEWNVYNFGTNGTIRLVVYNHFPLVTHPMHLHGHNYQVLAEGFGTWDGTITSPSNPNRRDTQILQKAQEDGTPAFIVLQFFADNAGVWPFHCHVAWHVSAGLYVNIVERPDEIKNYNIPSAISQTCQDWGAWTNQDVPDQIDSGL